MSTWLSLFGKLLDIPVTSIVRGLDELFTSDEERLQAKILFEKISQEPAKIQALINMITSLKKERSIFLEWRSFVGWVAGIGFLYDAVIAPIIVGIKTGAFYPTDTKEILIALLGLGVYKTCENIACKMKNK